MKGKAFAQSGPAYRMKMPNAENRMANKHYKLNYYFVYEPDVMVHYANRTGFADANVWYFCWNSEIFAPSLPDCCCNESSEERIVALFGGTGTHTFTENILSETFSANIEQILIPTIVGWM